MFCFFVSHRVSLITIYNIAYTYKNLNTPYLIRKWFVCILSSHFHTAISVECKPSLQHLHSSTLKQLMLLQMHCSNTFKRVCHAMSHMCQYRAFSLWYCASPTTNSKLPHRAPVYFPSETKHLTLQSTIALFSRHSFSLTCCHILHSRRFHLPLNIRLSIWWFRFLTQSMESIFNQRESRLWSAKLLRTTSV